MTSRPEKIRWLRKGEHVLDTDYIRWYDGFVSRRVHPLNKNEVSNGTRSGLDGITTGYFRFERATRRKARKTGRGK